MRNKYKCSKCHKIFFRNSDKAWIGMICDAGGEMQDCRLMLQKKLIKAKKRKEIIKL